MSGRTSSTAVRYWHTLRHLRAVQIYGRVWHRLHTPSVAMGPAPACRLASGSWTAPVAHRQKMIAPDRFCFLNEDGRVNNRDDWNDPHKAKLWLYNLHYFDDLNAAGAEQRGDWHRALIKRWIAENPAPHGNGWEPYPLSLRIVNWIKWALAGNELQPDWQLSLAVQVRFLARRLEWHLLGNHLFANAKALVFAGLFFEGREADRWLNKGLSLLAREIPEQILQDGGHFELSPMYHSIILEDMLDLINLANTYRCRLSSSVIDNWYETAQRMRAWLSVMCHPDGEISFFNDASFGVAPEPRIIEAYAARLGLAPIAPPRAGVTHLKDSGYIRVQQGDMVMLLDVARIGPGYIPGHAHADTLSFELSLFGKRVIVNSGISQYGTGLERLYQRSTAAHSTLEAEGESSSEVWGGFRVGRRARPFGLKIEHKSDGIIIRCSHDGYKRVGRNTIHSREWRIETNALKVTDHLSGGFGTAVSRFHLHPEISVIRKNDELELFSDRLRAVRCGHVAGELKLTDGHWFPAFNKSIASKTMEIDLVNAPSAQVVFQWT